MQNNVRVARVRRREMKTNAVHAEPAAAGPE